MAYYGRPQPTPGPAAEQGSVLSKPVLELTDLMGKVGFDTLSQLHRVAVSGHRRPLVAEQCWERILLSVLDWDQAVIDQEVGTLRSRVPGVDALYADAMRAFLRADEPRRVKVRTFDGFYTAFFKNLVLGGDGLAERRVSSFLLKGFYLDPARWVDRRAYHQRAVMVAMAACVNSIEPLGGRREPERTQPRSPAAAYPAPPAAYERPTAEALRYHQPPSPAWGDGPFTAPVVAAPAAWDPDQRALPPRPSPSQFSELVRRTSPKTGSGPGEDPAQAVPSPGSLGGQFAAPEPRTPSLFAKAIVDPSPDARTPPRTGDRDRDRVPWATASSPLATARALPLSPRPEPPQERPAPPRPASATPDRAAAPPSPAPSAFRQAVGSPYPIAPDKDQGRSPPLPSPSRSPRQDRTTLERKESSDSNAKPPPGSPATQVPSAAELPPSGAGQNEAEAKQTARSSPAKDVAGEAPAPSSDPAPSGHMPSPGHLPAEARAAPEEADEIRVFLPGCPAHPTPEEAASGPVQKTPTGVDAGEEPTRGTASPASPVPARASDDTLETETIDAQPAPSPQPSPLTSPSGGGASSRQMSADEWWQPVSSPRRNRAPVKPAAQPGSGRVTFSDEAPSQ